MKQVGTEGGERYRLPKSHPSAREAGRGVAAPLTQQGGLGAVPAGSTPWGTALSGTPHEHGETPELTPQGLEAFRSVHVPEEEGEAQLPDARRAWKRKASIFFTLTLLLIPSVWAFPHTNPFSNSIGQPGLRGSVMIPTTWS